MTSEGVGVSDAFELVAPMILSQIVWHTRKLLDDASRSQGDQGRAVQHSRPCTWTPKDPGKGKKGRNEVVYLPPT